MPEVDTEIEGVETEVESHRSCRKRLRKLLRRLQDDCKQVTIIIRAGQDCCRQTGCICDVTDTFLVLMDQNDACKRTYIPLDCICAVKNRVVEEDRKNTCTAK